MIRVFWFINRYRESIIMNFAIWIIIFTTHKIKDKNKNKYYRVHGLRLSSSRVNTFCGCWLAWIIVTDIFSPVFIHCWLLSVIFGGANGKKHLKIDFGPEISSKNRNNTKISHWRIFFLFFIILFAVVDCLSLWFKINCVFYEKLNFNDENIPFETKNKKNVFI